MLTCSLPGFGMKAHAFLRSDTGDGNVFFQALSHT